MAKISIDFSKPIGKIKPMHAVGQPPMLYIIVIMLSAGISDGIGIAPSHLGSYEVSPEPEILFPSLVISAITALPFVSILIGIASASGFAITKHPRLPSDAATA